MDGNELPTVPSEAAPPALPATFNPIDAAVGVITRPVEAMRQIAQARPWLLALLVAVLAALLSSLAGLTAPAAATDTAGLPPDLQRQLRPFLELQRSPGGLIAATVIGAPLALLISTVLIYVFAQLLRGRGPFSALFSTLGYASVPGLLAAPLSAVLNLGGGAFVALTGLLGFAVGIWSLVLNVIGTRESMNLSTGRAVAAVLLPSILLILLVCMAVVIIAAVAVAAVGGRG